MIKLHSQVLQQTIEVERIIGKYQGNQKGPTLIFMAGIHGNEPSGVFAIKTVLDELEGKKANVAGTVYAICGNLGALETGVRYQQIDLNRIWTHDKIDAHKQQVSEDLEHELSEQIDVYNSIQQILNTENGPFYFFDLHTTSSETSPFLTVNDSLLNRQFTRQYPVPIILGIEEYLEGPILSYINELGYVAFGFEGGQHNSPLAFQNHKSFVYVSLVLTGCMTPLEGEFLYHQHMLSKSWDLPQTFYEIVYHYSIPPMESFTMRPGYTNFQKISKNECLAIANEQVIQAPVAGNIFMPLYQGKGQDGFFIVKKVPRIFLRLSSLLRKIYFDRWLALLPGVRWSSPSRTSLEVNLKVARFFTRNFFHLLGYRNKKQDHTHLIVKNRETASRRSDYKNEKWYR
ncbi:MAG: succinylglutamate desuccinylase/aspartoacylase family protein [Bacteroidota bacterium]